MANLRNTLTEAQLKWLEDNIDIWYDVDDTTVTKYSTWTYVLIMQFIPGGNIASVIQLNNDGTTVGGGQRDVITEGYWQKVYDGTETANMYYYYINHGDNLVDSADTLELPSLPTTRLVVDTQDLIAVKDSRWTWLNLYRVLTLLKDNVEAIPQVTSERQNISFEWDSNMSWRILSPYMSNWVKGLITESNIANYLKAQFADKWNKLYDALTAEYNPLHNYDMHEIEHTDDVRDEDTTTSGTGSRSGSVTTEDDTTTSNTTTETLNTSVVTADDATNTHDVYAFNSESYSHATKDTSEADRTNTTTGTNTNADSGSSSTDTSTTSTESTTSSGTVGYTTDNDKDRELTRSGNIGVTTSQQLLEAELKLRQNIVLDTIKDDIIATLTIPYYGGKY